MLSIEEEDALDKGTVIEINQELMICTDLNAVTNTITVKRGMKGTSAAAHTAGDLIKLSPPFPRKNVFDAVCDQIKNLFPTLFWKENFNDLTISKENQITFNQILNRENELYAKICSAIICDLDSVYKEHKKAFLGDGEYSCPEFTELDDYRDTRICGKMYGWVITAAYMGYISSYQTAFVDFFNDINKLGFDGSMEKHYGLTKLEFYKQYSDFMRSDPSNLTPPPGFFPSKLSEEVNFFLVDSGN